MTDPGPPTVERDCIIVGGGLAGLACAQRLATSGRSVLVLEADEAPGGRARTVWHRGRPVDRGFQVLFRSYPQTRGLLRAIGLPRRDLRPVGGGAVFIDGGETHRLGASKLAAVRFGGMRPRDRALLMRFAASVVARPPEALLEAPSPRSALELLRDLGFSGEAIDRFFRPLFGVITLDRSLGADEGYFRFLMSMLARGPSVIPSDGLGMLAEWTSASIRQAGGAVELGVRVTGIETSEDGRRATGARTEDGRLVRARHVVLAVEAPVARVLLAPLDPAAAERLPREAASSVGAAFALRRPLYRGRSIVLNAATPRDDDGSRVDLLCQTTNITRPGAPDGPHILLATRVTTGGGGADGLVEAVGDLVRRWAPGFDWAGLAEPIGVYTHPFAQFRPLPGVRERLPGARTAVDNLLLAGDLTAHPSIEGAVSSGFRAAGIVDALTP